jgi:hypothetical protein
MPPKFDVESLESVPPVLLPPQSSIRSTRARSTRSASPSKAMTPRKIAQPSPRKRATRSAAKAESVNGDESAEATKPTAASSALQHAVENGATASESVASESVNGEVKGEQKLEQKEDTVRIEVQETIEQHGDVETATTNVKIDVPAEHPELPTPDDPTQLIEEARRMVAEAKGLDGGAVDGSSKSSKRKAEELVDEDVEVSERPAKQAKTTYTTEQKLTKEKVTRRALVGLGVMAAIG